jgi:hypothetical protein
MKIHRNIAQGTPEWLALRLGRPTASCFDKIVTPAKGELSKSSRAYAQQLVAEVILGEPIEAPIGNLHWVAWGKEHEPQAVQQYSFSMDVEVEEVGFITSDDGRVGCSPDRLIVGQKGCLEVKSPAPQTHVGYLIDGPGLEYKCQLQGQLLVGEFDFVDFYSFHPTMAPALHRVGRDEPYIAKLAAALREFCDVRDAMLAVARNSGCLEARAALRQAA